MNIADNLKLIQNSLPNHLSLVAVSKTKPIEDIQLAYDAGQRVFGENKVQEAKKKFPQKWISDNKLVFLDDSYAALEKSDALVLMTEWKMFRNPSLSKMKELMKNLCIFDGRNQYDPDYMRKNGFEYKGIGR